MKSTKLQLITTVKAYSRSADVLARHTQVQWPAFPSELDRIVHNTFHPDAPLDLDDLNEGVQIPHIQPNINVVASATAIFFAPSDICGVGGMRKEIIRVTQSWRGGPSRYDCVFVQTDRRVPGFRGLNIARIKLLFSFKHDGHEFSCALVHWFERVANSNAPDDDTGMWVVEPEYKDDPAAANNGRQPRPQVPALEIIPVDTILRAAHLIPVYSNEFIPLDVNLSNVLSKFKRYFVNKYADHHSYEIAF